MDYSWTQNSDLLVACQRFQVCCETPPDKFCYTPFESILQNGPKCGLIALAMYCQFADKVDEIYQTAQALNFTFNGEMFSVDDMCTLTRKYTDKRVEVFSGYLMCKDIQEFLLNKGVMFVPYDSDANHSPCLKNGHKAHWALISGIIISNGNTYILARQGKSLHLGIWSLQELADSNSQLTEFSPSRQHSNLSYKLPEGGIEGPKGLKNKCVLIYD